MVPRPDMVTIAGDFRVADAMEVSLLHGLSRIPVTGTGIDDVTGIIYEPWHFRYVGRIHAWYLHHSGLCLEEYAARIDAGGVRWRHRDMRYEVTAGKPGLGTTLTECALYTDGGTVYTTVCAMPARGTLWPLQ